MPYLLMLTVASRLAPRAIRGEWLREWQAELWHLVHYGDRRRALSFCSGAFRDAMWLRVDAAGAFGRDIRRLSTPGACLAVLTLQAAIAALVLWTSPAVQSCVWDRPVLAHACIAAGAMLVYSLIPGVRRFEARGVRGWTFLFAKMAVLMVLVFFATFDIVPLISRTPVQPQLAFIGYVLAYRWAACDQRKRCPTCLRRLVNPVRIGHSAGTLLEWYGEELICSEGHGVMLEPELAESSYCSRQWVRLDASWRELF